MLKLIAFIVQILAFGLFAFSAYASEQEMQCFYAIYDGHNMTYKTMQYRQNQNDFVGFISDGINTGYMFRVSLNDKVVHARISYGYKESGTIVSQSLRDISVAIGQGFKLTHNIKESIFADLLCAYRRGGFTYQIVHESIN